MIYVSFLIFNAKLHNNYQLCNNYVKIYGNMMYNYLIIACYVTFWEIFIRYPLSAHCGILDFAKREVRMAVKRPIATTGISVSRMS